MAVLGRRFRGKDPTAPVGEFPHSWTVNTAGWISRPVAAIEGEVPTGQTLHLNGVAGQLDRFLAWPDGSLRHGMLTVNAVGTGVQELTVAAPSGSTFSPTFPAATVAFEIIAGEGAGFTYTATLGAYSATDFYLSNGDKVNETRQVTTPVKAGPVEHPNLRVVWDVRAYSGGGFLIDVIVDNARDNAEMDMSQYHCIITIGGVERYNSETTDYIDGMKHFSFTSWHKEIYHAMTPGDADIDLDSFYAAKLLYKPQAGMVAKDWTADFRWNNRLYFGPLRFGMYDPKMNAAAGRPELSPFPMWDMEYLATQNATNFAIIKQHAMATAAWTGGRIWKNDNTGFYRTNDGTHTIMTHWPQNPGLSYPTVLRAPTEIAAGGAQYIGARDLHNDGDPDPDDDYPVEEQQPRLDNEHPPDAVTVPYAVIGSRFLKDQLKHWANIWIMRSPAGSGQFETGIPFGRNHGTYNSIIVWGGFAGTSRGFARPFRIIVNAANLIPDADATDKAYFISAVNDNLDFFKTYHNTRATTGDPYHDSAVFWENVNNSQFWEYDIDSLPSYVVERSILYNQAFGNFEFAHTLWWADHVGIFTVHADTMAFCDRLLQWQSSAMSTGSDAVFNRLWALNAYYPPVGERAGGSLGGTITLTSGLADFAARAARDLTPISQAGLYQKFDLVCNNSTTVSSATSDQFNSSYINAPLIIGGTPGSNWLEDAYEPNGGFRVGIPGIYYIQSVINSSTVVLDRKPVTDGTSATGGYYRILAYPMAPLDYNGTTSMLGLKVAVARGLTGATTAMAYAEAYSSGGLTLNDLLRGTNGGAAYGYVGYGIDLT